MSARARPKPAGHRLQPGWISSVPVQRWMRQPVVTIDAALPVRDAVALMRERGLRHLPVLDADKRLVGIVTDRDLRQLMFDVALGRADEETAQRGALPVRQVMTWGVVTVTPTTELREAVAVMRERRLGALPVVDATGRVVGILTERDLLAALQALLRERVAHPAPAAVAPGATEEPDREPVPDADPWQNMIALD
jgi:CBS domain-containing protein